MHALHERTLKRIFQVEDDRGVKFSGKLLGRINKAEERMVKYHGSFIEFNVDILLAIIADVSDEDIFENKLPQESQEEQAVDYSKLNRSDIIKECASRNIDIRGNESKADLVQILKNNDEVKANG